MIETGIFSIIAEIVEKSKEQPKNSAVPCLDWLKPVKRAYEIEQRGKCEGGKKPPSRSIKPVLQAFEKPVKPQQRGERQFATLQGTAEKFGCSLLRLAETGKTDL